MRLMEGSYYSVFVETDLNKAMDMYYAEQIVLGAEDMKGVDFAPNTSFRYQLLLCFD